MFTDAQKIEYLLQQDSSGLTAVEFSKQVGVHAGILSRWRIELSRKKKPSKIKKQIHRGPYPADQRIQTVETFLQSGLTQKDFAQTLGMSFKTFSKWVAAYNKGGKKD